LSPLTISYPSLQSLPHLPSFALIYPLNRHFTPIYPLLSPICAILSPLYPLLSPLYHLLPLFTIFVSFTIICLQLLSLTILYSHLSHLYPL
jgi:hypothetical protein